MEHRDPGGAGMCLAVPARIIELKACEAVIEIRGVRRRCNVAFIEAPAAGDHVLVHAGFAIQKWSDEDVREYEEIVGGRREERPPAPDTR
jgi:hydrogenase expression/formation protein HypC